ncbi:MAG: hypothetical protein GC159_17235 [Phycisphaera sp.]|nr:hypothetical protein [Phycisphaera sp.]
MNTRGENPPIVSLLTDFGTADAYVGVMKGVILSRCPAARIVDITHDVEPGNVHAAGHLLRGAWRYFPAGTVHTVVVDPGVGSDRRVLAAEVDGHRFVGPDNGVLSGVFDDVAPSRVIDVTNDALFLKPVSRTFHGRDIFAPVAASLACGVALDELGDVVDSWIHLPRLAPATDASGAVIGQIVYVDRFGNLVSNIEEADVSAMARPVVHIGGRAIAGVSTSYASVDEGKLVAVIGSTGRLEISVNRGSAAERLRAAVGTELRVADEEATA